MWPFKKRKRFIIVLVDRGLYYTASEDKPVWSAFIDEAMRFDRASADRVKTTMIIDAIGGVVTYGATAIVEL